MNIMGSLFRNLNYCIIINRPISQTKPESESPLILRRFLNRFCSQISHFVVIRGNQILQNYYCFPLFNP